MNGKLAEPSNWEEINKTKNFAFSGAKNISYWIGLSDLGHEGTFKWASSNITLAEITDWNYGQPDNWKGIEHCVVIRKSYGYKWNDQSCSSPTYGLCQMKKFKYFISNVNLNFDEASNVRGHSNNTCQFFG